MGCYEEEKKVIKDSTAERCTSVMGRSSRTMQAARCHGEGKRRTGNFSSRSGRRDVRRRRSQGRMRRWGLPVLETLREAPAPPLLNACLVTVKLKMQ